MNFQNLSFQNDDVTLERGDRECQQQDMSDQSQLYSTAKEPEIT